MASATSSKAVPVEDERLKPWKFQGYPGFARWMASSDDFFVLRRFGQMNTRVLLLMQDRITRKEEELLKLDEAARKGSDIEGIANSLRHDPQEERTMILDELKVQLKEYNEYLVTYAQIKSWKSAEKRQTQNVENWFSNHPTAICDEEQGFIRAGGDVTALRFISKSPLRRLLQKCQPLVLSSLFRLKRRPDHVDTNTTFYQSNTAFDTFINVIVIAVGLMLLIGPMWTLQFVTNDVKRLAIITGFTLLFTSILTGATTAKPFEVLAATAAYSAVLMVFLQTGPQASLH